MYPPPLPSPHLHVREQHRPCLIAHWQASGAQTSYPRPHMPHIIEYIHE
jgi:hypothetical protein